MNRYPIVGDIIKVMLPVNSPKSMCSAETPWAEVVALHADGSIDARIDNYLVEGEAHGFKVHQIVRFRFLPAEYGSWWQPDVSRRN